MIVEVMVVFNGRVTNGGSVFEWAFCNSELEPAIARASSHNYVREG